jgi:hypothetical protein
MFQWDGGLGDARIWMTMVIGEMSDVEFGGTAKPLNVMVFLASPFPQRFFISGVWGRRAQHAFA